MPTRDLICDPVASSLLPFRDAKERRLEAGCVADGEQLLRVRCGAVIPAHRCWNREIHFESAVACSAMTFATALDNRLCAVEHFLQLGLAWLQAPLARLSVVVDDFDVVAVGVEDICGVVAGVIAGALTGLAVAAVSGRGCVGVESAYVCARERDVDAFRRTAGEDEE